MIINENGRRKLGISPTNMLKWNIKCRNINKKTYQLGAACSGRTMFLKEIKIDLVFN